MIGVVVAGGASSRMGSDKALIEVAGRPMISWVIGALRSVVDQVVVAGRPGGWEEHRGLADPDGVPGPLAGLAASLQLGKPVLLVAVDQPWVRTATLAKLASVGETSVPIHNDTRQVTCAVYYPDLSSMIAKHGSLQSLLDGALPLEITEPVWKSWGEDGRSWFSVDRPEDVGMGLERFGVPGA
jgi:molybdopterin-guanine dinucleotide biosynthesis protein A